MTKGLLTAVCVLALVSGCSRVANSRINPLNWFGGSRQVERQLPAEPAMSEIETDPRPLVDEVTQLSIERTPSGAIIRTTGLPPRQGYWEGELVPADPSGPVDGVLIYRFRAAQPPRPTRVSTEVSRLIEVATVLSNQSLAPVSEIRVEAARNARAVRR